jgi:hypothetical protein
MILSTALPARRTMKFLPGKGGSHRRTVTIVRAQDCQNRKILSCASLTECLVLGWRDSG